MAEYNLAIIGGDGVGPEVIAEGRKTLAVRRCPPREGRPSGSPNSRGAATTTARPDG